MASQEPGSCVFEPLLATGARDPRTRFSDGLDGLRALAIGVTVETSAREKRVVEMSEVGL
ncbi:hypothetical protein PX699_08095 [Sphingobium sp. H39-3-25]|uniref:hypothetical protein n=1 Tax=Sphingobium arseniciresistens TaxID=3030834 RepID=UPI0023BA3934|nr:hypothetical protein [Sphingobium arseniciresistens]